MRRDHELIRRLILHLEDHDEVDSYRDQTAFPEYVEITIARHIEDLIKEGFAEGKVLRTATPPGIASAFANRLTSPGHDFAERIRGESGWARVREVVDLAAPDVGEFISQVFYYAELCGRTDFEGGPDSYLFSQCVATLVRHAGFGGMIVPGVRKTESQYTNVVLFDPIRWPSWSRGRAGFRRIV